MLDIVKMTLAMTSVLRFGDIQMVKNDADGSDAFENLNHHTKLLGVIVKRDAREVGPGWPWNSQREGPQCLPLTPS